MRAVAMRVPSLGRVWVGVAAATVLYACMACGRPARADEDVEALAARVLDAVDRPVGLVHLPRCRDGALALALAAADENLRLHAQEADPAAVAAARRAADEAGLLGRRMWIDQCGTSRLLPVRRSCDLVVLTDLGREDLTPELAAEVRRVLHPWYGVAVLGDGSGMLDRAALMGWAKGIGAEVSPLAGGGALVTVEAGPLEGADNWTHWWHGPDNNAVSNDYAYSVPETIQWTGKPFFSTRLELPIVSNGRVFMLWNGHLLDMTPGEPLLPGEDVALDNRGERWKPDVAVETLRGPLLTAQAVGSGARLWARRLSPAAWLQVARSTMVADGDRLLVADGPSILELDQATGEELRRTDPNCGEIRWMAVADGCVLLLGGPVTQNLGRRTEALVAPFRSSGLGLLALDRDTLKERWRIERDGGADAFDPRSPAVAGGRLFVCTEGGQAEAYRVADGTPQWHADTGIVRLPPRGYEWDRSSRHPVTGYAVAGLYVISGPETDRCAVLAQEDGRPMWELARGGGPVGPIPLALRGLLWVGGNGMDPVTGESSRKVNLDRGGCSRFTAAPQGIFGTEGLTWDVIADEARRVIPAKSGCGAGQYAANGLVWKFPTPCSGCMEWRGFIPRAPAEQGLPPAGPRLAYRAEGTASQIEADGWTTYRADAQRSASTAARVGIDPEIAWHVPPVHPAGPGSIGVAVMFATEIVPAPPVIVGDTVVVGGADGAVDALDLDTGEPLWRAYTGGRVYSSPAVWQGRVFVGSADGCLYAFGLADGRELWRLRVGPDAGRMMLYEQLGSRWPILGSPLVAERRVYVTAGLFDMLDGVCAVAADAASGRILWERTDWADAEVADVVSGTGQLCWDGEVVFHGGEAPLVRLGPADGACRIGWARGRVEELTSGWPQNWQGIKAFYSTFKGAKGQDVGALAPGLMAFGGRRLLTDQSEDGAWRDGLTFLTQDEGGDGRFPLLRAEECVLMPSWDDRDVQFLLGPRHARSVVLVSQAKLRAALDALITPEGEGPRRRYAT